MRHAPAALAVLLLTLATLTGCQNPQTPPLVQVYAAKQAYAGSLDALTTAINTGRITDANTLMRIRDARTVIEAGLAEADKAARAGDAANFRFWIDRVNAALETYLKLQGPAPTTRPAVSLNPETPWTPRRSPPSSSPALAPLPRWRTPSAPSSLAGRSAPTSRPSSTVSWLPRVPETTPR